MKGLMKEYEKGHFYNQLLHCLPLLFHHTLYFKKDVCTAVLFAEANTGHHTTF
jgi:hypothetical protein